MLKQLLKYEFKATKSLYFGLYLALALLSVVLGVTFRQEHALAPVSYTHLDVYKRQTYTRPSRWKNIGTKERIKPLRHCFAMPPPLVGEALAAG